MKRRKMGRKGSMLLEGTEEQELISLNIQFWCGAEYSVQKNLLFAALMRIATYAHITRCSRTTRRLIQRHNGLEQHMPF